MFGQYEIEEELELEYQSTRRPERTSRRPPQSYSPRFDKQRTSSAARHGIQRRGTRARFVSV